MLPRHRNSRAISRRIPEVKRPCSARTAAAGAASGRRSAACASQDAAHLRVSPEPQVRERSVWGWGWTGAGPDPEQTRVSPRLSRRGLGSMPSLPRLRPRSTDLRLPAPRCEPPAALASLCSTGTRARAAHTYGKSFRDLVRGLRGDFSNPPDVVAHPRSEDDVARGPRLVRGLRAAVIPYGGGSSVVGGVEPPPRDASSRAWSRSTSRASTGCSRSIATSRAARIQAGVLGPALEEQLRPHGLTLRHFPQSFEFSTLGGWIATRSGGHYATLYTHIDDFVESLRVVTPAGIVADAPPARLGRRAEPRPALHRLRGHPRHHHRGVDAPAGSPDVPRRRPASPSPTSRRVRRRRAPSRRRASIPPTAACSIPARPRSSGAGSGRRGASCSWPSSPPTTRSTPWMARALECARDHGGRVPAGAGARARRTRGRARAPPGAWRRAFLDAPYLRNAIVAPRHGERDLRDRDHLGSLPGVPRGRDRAPPRRRPRASAAPGTSPAASRTSTRTAPRPTTRSSPRAAAAPSSSSGPRSRPPPRTPSCATAAPSPTTTPSAATTGPGTTRSGPSSSPTRCGPPSAPSIPRGILNPGRADRSRCPDGSAITPRRRAPRAAPAG